MKGMNERHELKMHGREPEAWPQKKPELLSASGWLMWYVCRYQQLDQDYKQFGSSAKLFNRCIETESRDPGTD